MAAFKRFIFFSSMIFMLPASGAALPLQGSREVKLFGDAYSGLQQILLDLEEVGDGGQIHMDAFVLTNEKLVQSLIKAHGRGALVHVNADGSFPLNKTLVASLKEAGVAVNDSELNHNKRVLIDTGTEKISYLGSANSSYNAYQNLEVVTRSICPEVYAQLRADHGVIAGSPERPGRAKALAAMEFKATPQRPTAATSTSPDCPLLDKVVRGRLNFEDDEGSCGTLLALRRSSRLEEKRGSRSISLATMGLTDSPIKHDLIALAQDQENIDCRILVDGSTLQSQEGLRHMQELHEAGVNVFIYNPYGDIKRGTIASIGHAKMLVRKAYKNEKNLVVVSTQNLTMGTDSFNSALLIPGDAQAVEDASAIYDAMIAKADRYDDINWGLVSSAGKKRKRESDKKELPVAKRARHR